MKVRLVSDSSANLYAFEGVDFKDVPLTIRTSEKEYVDVEGMDVYGMLKDLREYKGKSGTACPSVKDWKEAFEGADEVYGVAITSNLSGCYNAGRLAIDEYKEEHPEKKVFLLDSLSTGPEMALILEKYRELIDSGMAFEDICTTIQDYCDHKSHLLFSLESVNNLARNGRVSPVVAAAVGVLGIRIVGRASDEGTLETLHKCRGEKKAIQQIVTCMLEENYRGGKVRIHHSYNPTGAAKLAETIHVLYPDADISIGLNHGLCGFYAEEGGILVGYESE